MTQDNNTKEQSFFKYIFNFKEISAELVNQRGFKTLDGVRAIGMFWIIMHHCYAVTAHITYKHLNFEERAAIIDGTSSLENWVVGAQYLLDIFFLFSGFLMAFLLFREWGKTGAINPKKFYYRRFMRIMPIYIFIIAVTFIGLWIVNPPGIEKKYLITNLFYINNFFPFEKNPLPWTWSLAVEEQFYFILPFFLIAIKMRRFMIWMAAFMVLACLIRYWVVIANPILHETQLYVHAIDETTNLAFKSILYDNLYTRFGSFICGISVAYLLYFHAEKTGKFLHFTWTGRIISLGSLAILFVMLFIINLYKSTVELDEFWRILYLSIHRNLFSICGAIFMFLLIIESPYVSILARFFKRKFWYPFAQLTYSAYLIHFIIVVMAAGLLNQKFGLVYGDGIYLPLTMLISIIFTYIISYILFLLIEAPFLRWRNMKSGKSFRDEVKDGAKKMSSQ